MLGLASPQVLQLTPVYTKARKVLLQEALQMFLPSLQGPSTFLRPMKPLLLLWRLMPSLVLCVSWFGNAVCNVKTLWDTFTRYQLVVSSFSTESSLRASTGYNLFCILPGFSLPVPSGYLEKSGLYYIWSSKKPWEIGIIIIPIIRLRT